VSAKVPDTSIYQKVPHQLLLLNSLYERNVIGFGSCSKENWGLQIKTATQILNKIHDLSLLLKNEHFLTAQLSSELRSQGTATLDCKGAVTTT